MQGSNIFVKGIQSMERTCTKGERVCIVVNICNTNLPRGSDLDCMMVKTCTFNLFAFVVALSARVFWNSLAAKCFPWNPVWQSIKSIALPVFFHHYIVRIVDLPPLESLPNDFLMQNFPSLITSHILDPQPGDSILDCCAAPGNKWSHLCMLMQDKGLVLGMDRSRKKAIDNLLAIKQKFGYQSLQIRYLDMTKVRI